MAVYAIVKAGVVVNTVIADPSDPKPEGETWVEVADPVPPSVSVGWTYDYTLRAFSNPANAPG